MEWIVVDDGSDPTNAAEHCEVVHSVSSAVRTDFIEISERVGLSKARNLGIARAHGDWVVVLDSDDKLGSELVPMLLALPASSLLVSCNSIYFDENVTEYRDVQPFAELFLSYGGTSLDPFLWWDFYYHGIIARRSLVDFIGGYRGNLDVGEDQDILLRAAQVAGKGRVTFLSEVGYEYRKNPEGVCASHWSEILGNYTKTMLEAAVARAAPFDKCEFGGVDDTTGVSVDFYRYRARDGKWHDWHSWRRIEPVGRSGNEAYRLR